MSIYWKLIWAYIKIGIFGFGGGYAMQSLVEQSVVNPGWISEQMFTDIVAISQMTPGPIGINSATYIGYIAPGTVNPELTGFMWGILGSVLCTLAVTLPSYFLVLERKENQNTSDTYHNSGRNLRVNSLLLILPATSIRYELRRKT